MRRLLVRIFGAMVLTNSLAMLGMVLVYGGGFDRHRAHDMYLVDAALRSEGTRILHTLQTQGRQPADAELEVLGTQTGLTAALTSSTGVLLAGALSGDVATRAHLLATAAPHTPMHLNNMHAVTIDGALVFGARTGRRGAMPLSPPSMQLVLVVLLSGVVSLLLSRWLAGPLQALRSGTDRLAVGPGRVRVMPAMPRFADAEVLALAHDFDRMAERIEGLLESQERLLRDVSHELRSPLARLAVALELARDRAGPDAQSALDRIDKEAGRLGELIGLVLTMAKLERSPQVENTEEVRLDQLAELVFEDAAFEAKASDRTVELRSVEAATVQGNEELLRQALENVVRNALKWTPEGGAVEIALQRGAGASQCIRFVVRDHGPGVPEAALEQIFLPFARVQNARERTSGGAGLGLAITARAVQLHGGRVEAKNHPEGGLVVIVELPGHWHDPLPAPPVGAREIMGSS